MEHNPLLIVPGSLQSPSRNTLLSPLPSLEILIPILAILGIANCLFNNKNHVDDSIPQGRWPIEPDSHT